MARREERRLVTCLFIDVVGSTEMTVALGPERLKGSLEAAFAALRGLIEREGGTVEKYVGDAIYAIFGSPVAHADDPVRALRAAAGTRDWARSRADADIPFSVRIGVETGEAIVDLTAAETTHQQLSVGAVVNIAARLQQRAEPGQVLVGPVAREAAMDTATFTPLGPVELKGIGSLEVAASGHAVLRLVDDLAQHTSGTAAGEPVVTLVGLQPLGADCPRRCCLDIRLPCPHADLLLVRIRVLCIMSRSGAGGQQHEHPVTRLPGATGPLPATAMAARGRAGGPAVRLHRVAARRPPDFTLLH